MDNLRRIAGSFGWKRPRRKSDFAESYASEVSRNKKPGPSKVAVILAGVMVLAGGATFAVKGEDIRYSYLVNRGAVSMKADKLDHAKQFYMEAQAHAGGNDSFQTNCSDWISKIDGLIASRDAFDRGRVLYGEKRYVDALRSFSGVSMEDEKRYAESQSLIEEVKPIVMSALRTDYKEAFDIGAYGRAREIAGDLEMLGEDMSDEMRQLDVQELYVKYEDFFMKGSYSQAYDALDRLSGMGEDVDGKYSELDDAKASDFLHTFEGVNFLIDSPDMRYLTIQLTDKSRISYDRDDDAYYGRMEDGKRAKFVVNDRYAYNAFDYYNVHGRHGRVDFIGTYCSYN